MYTVAYSLQIIQLNYKYSFVKCISFFLQITINSRQYIKSIVSAFCTTEKMADILQTLDPNRIIVEKTKKY